MAETNLLVVTDTFLSRLIMKAWLTCALEAECLMALGSLSKCQGSSSGRHRYDKSAMVIILTHFFFQNSKLSKSSSKYNNPAPYDMFTSVQMNMGTNQRESSEPYYLLDKKIA